jgi:DNA-directed RNA polymerase specialized sigma subunit
MLINYYSVIQKAKNGDKDAMTRLIKQFYPLMKRHAGYFHQIGLEYDDVFQQAALLFITGVLQYKEMPPVTFAGFMKKRIKWGLWGYWRKTKKYTV